MPWLSNDFSLIVSRAKKLIEKEFGVKTKTKPYLCNKEEIIVQTKKELSKFDLSKENYIKLVESVLPSLMGKFFKDMDEIWIIEEETNNFPLIVHELLHSIQICSPQREGIVDYITYKLTGSRTCIDPYIKEDWKELERIHGFFLIKKQLLRKGNCEDL